MGARMMGDDDLPDSGRRIFADLRADVDQLDRTVQGLAGRLEKIAVIGERVETNRQEIDRLRSTVDSPGGVSDRVAKMENGKVAELMPWKLLIGVISAIATIIAAAITAAAMLLAGV